MNLKDRLKSSVKLKKIQNNPIMNVKDFNDNSFLSCFVKNEKVDSILSEILVANCNVIFASSIECDDVIIASYIKSLLPIDTSVEMIYDFNSNIKFANSSKIIFPSPRIKDFVKILEYIQYGYKNFIFGMNICQSKNIVDIIKTLVLLNCSNLTEKNVDTLLSTASPYIVYFDKNSDGLMVVTDILKLFNDGNYLKSETLLLGEPNLSKKVEQKQSVIVEQFSDDLSENNEKNEVSSARVFETEEVVLQGEIENLVETETETEEITEPNLVVDVNQSEEFVAKNKYKLLKEKLKRKKQQL